MTKPKKDSLTKEEIESLKLLMEIGKGRMTIQAKKSNGPLVYKKKRGTLEGTVVSMNLPQGDERNLCEVVIKCRNGNGIFGSELHLTAQELGIPIKSLFVGRKLTFLVK